MEVSFCMASGIVKEKQYLSIFIMIVAFIANYFYKVSAIVLILLCIAFRCGCLHCTRRKRPKTTVILPNLTNRRRYIMIYLQLFSVFFRSVPSASEAAIFAMPLIKPGSPAPSMAFPVKFTDPDHHFPDDTGTYCRQFRYLCRDPYCRSARGFRTLLPAVFYRPHFSYITGKIYLKYRI